jgi:hypothetical protein
LLLDLALQSRPAVRHALANCPDLPPLLGRLAIVTLVVEGYCRWSRSNTEGKFFEQEFEFYLCCGDAAAGLAIFLCVSLVSVLGSRGTESGARLLTGLLLAYCTRFLGLAALLWATPDTAFLWTFVDLLFLLTSVTVLRVASRLSMAAAWAAALAAHGALHLHSALTPAILAGGLACI